MHDLPVDFKVKTEFIEGDFDDLENRIDEIKCNPESAGSSFNDFDKKMRAKYGF